MTNQHSSLTELGKMIDGLYEARQARLKLDKEVDALKAEETALRGRVMRALNEAGLTGGRGDVAIVGLTKEEVPRVDDWEGLRNHIALNDAWDLLQNRLSAIACRARWTRGEAIPGVTKVEIEDLSLHKATR